MSMRSVLPIAVVVAVFGSVSLTFADPFDLVGPGVKYDNHPLDGPGEPVAPGETIIVRIANHTPGYDVFVLYLAGFAGPAGKKPVVLAYNAVVIPEGTSASVSLSNPPTSGEVGTALIVAGLGGKPGSSAHVDHD